MKKNILIIGYGDLGKRLTDILDRNLYNFFHVSRNNKYNSDDFIEWDWSSKKEFEKNFKQIDVVIFFPKPSSNDESGYEAGFKNSAENLNKIIVKLPIEKFISKAIFSCLYSSYSSPLYNVTSLLISLSSLKKLCFRNLFFF